MTERGAGFDAKREAYEAAQKNLLDLIDHPDKSVPVREYRLQLAAASAAVQEAHEDMMCAHRRTYFPRTRGTRSPVRSLAAEEMPAYPPDPSWGADERGRFRYVDYDGESLHIRHEDDGDLWIDKNGQGPVYIRKEDMPVIVAALTAKRDCPKP